MIEVRLFPHSTRPGVGLKPRQVSARPLVSRDSRQCPVPEAGSGLGLLVYPPLEEHEAFEVEFQGDGRYLFTFYMGSGSTQWQPMFRTTMALPVGGIGKIKEDVAVMAGAPISADAARSLARMFIVPEDLGTPAGAITVRGAANFQTPDGWDTVYTAVLDHIERPLAPVMVVRVETDWYAHETEFRYVLQAGEAISGSRNIPVGQVFFVPRETVTLRDCTADELAAIRESKREFARQKPAVTVSPAHGLEDSPASARHSESRKP